MPGPKPTQMGKGMGPSRAIIPGYEFVINNSIDAILIFAKSRRADATHTSLTHVQTYRLRMLQSNKKLIIIIIINAFLLFIRHNCLILRLSEIHFSRGGKGRTDHMGKLKRQISN